MVLKELGLPHEIVDISLQDAKKPDYVDHVNPNGRIPAIHDPNTDLTLWESGAIIMYLVSTSDDGTISTARQSPDVSLRLISMIAIAS